MSALSIHPIEYVKLHVHFDTRLRGARLLAAMVAKIFDFAEPAAAGAVVLLITALAIVSFMQISAATLMTSYYIDAISRIIFTP